MLTKDDLAKIKELLKPLENKIDSLTLETKAIHLIITNERREFDERLERLEEHAGITS